MGKMSITTRGAYTVRPAVKSDRVIIECRAGGLSPAGVPGRQVQMDLSLEEATKLVKDLTDSIMEQGVRKVQASYLAADTAQAAFEVVGSLTYDSATDALTGASQSPSEQYRQDYNKYQGKTD